MAPVGTGFWIILRIPQDMNCLWWDVPIQNVRTEVLLRQLVSYSIFPELGYPRLPHDGVFKIEYIGIIIIIIIYRISVSELRYVQLDGRRVQDKGRKNPCLILSNNSCHTVGGTKSSWQKQAERCQWESFPCPYYNGGKISHKCTSCRAFCG